MNIQEYKAFTIEYPNIASTIITSAEICTPISILSDSEMQIKNTCLAIWDTGATCSVVTELTAQKLNLLPIGRISVSGLGGTQYKNVYIVDLKLPNGTEIYDLLVSELDNPSDEDGKKIDTFGLLIGMDVISKGDFIITNFEGKTTMSFREPSCYKVDYVDQLNKNDSK